MEITLLEDPCCPWCWAFQPVTTAIEFELLGSSARRPLRLRHVLGGLSDRPVVEGSFHARTWLSAAAISEMPFRTEIWDRHLLKTTFEACRAVKAAQPLLAAHVERFLRRLREAYFVEGIPIDGQETLLEIARAEGLDAELLRENLVNGRAEILFDRDRQEAAPYRFGFPTLLVRKHPNDPPTVFHGVVCYSDIIAHLHRIGLHPNDRRRFVDRPEDWARLFSLRRRLALAEIRLVTGLEGDALAESLARNGIAEEGAFLVRRTIPIIPPSCAISGPLPAHVLN